MASGFHLEDKKPFAGRFAPFEGERARHGTTPDLSPTPVVSYRASCPSPRHSVGPDGIPDSATAWAIDRCKPLFRTARGYPPPQRRGKQPDAPRRPRVISRRARCAAQSRSLPRRVGRWDKGSWHEDRREAKNNPQTVFVIPPKRTQTEPAEWDYPITRRGFLQEKLGQWFTKTFTTEARRHGEN